MDKILKWGLLSTARINRALIPPLNHSSRNTLQAVASRSLAAAEAYAREWNIPEALGSYEALIQDPRIDVIYNSLPNHLHAEWSIKALQAGKHVLCEKPLALTLAEVDSMTQAAQSAGRVLAEAFMYRSHPQTIKIQELVKSGALGRLQLLKGAFTFVLSHPNDIRSIKDLGGGSIWDVGCYPISYMRMITGAEPVEVFGWQLDSPGGIDESFAGQMRFPNEILAQFDCGFKSPSRSFIEIVGSQAKLDIPVPFKPGENEKLILTREDQIELLEIEGQPLYAGEVEDLADAILLGTPPRVTLADSRGNVAAILGLLESARINKPITL